MSARPIDFGAPTTAPRRIGKYVVSHVLGEGAMGIVYKGVDPHIDRPVAIKTVRRQLLAPGAQDLSAALRFQREAKAAGRLSHPNIVPVYEYGEDGADLYIAMEYIEGSSLLNLTAHGNRLCTEDALSVMLQLLDALQCAHSQEVWHRDIKPGNLLITADGRLKVTDFGIARIDSAHLTQMNTVMGSPGYMAPERYTGDAPDSRVDLFSCGVVLYELLAGTAPFKGSVSEVMYQVLNRDPQPPSTLNIPNPPPACFDAVVAKAMARRAADRYGSAIEMRDALFAASAQPIRRLLSGQTLARLRPPLTDVPTQFRQDEVAAAAAAAMIANAPTQWLGRQPVPPTSDQSTLPGAAGMIASPRVAVAPAAAEPPSAPSVPSARAASFSAPFTESVPFADSLPFAPSAPFPVNADAETLTRIDRVLRTHLGPVSRYVLRDAARRLPDLAMLVDHITEQHVAPADRESFRRQIDAAVPGLHGATPRAATQPAPAPQAAATGGTPLRPEVIEQAQRLLATHIGPIATVVVRRAAASAASREQFFSLLVDQAGDGADRKELMAQLWRLA